MRKSIEILATILLLQALFGFSIARSEVAVVVNLENPINELDSKYIKNLYLGKQKRFPDGAIAVTIDKKAPDKNRDIFNRDIIGKNNSQLRSYWAQRIFTGKGQPPKQIEGDDEIKKLVSKNPSIISYISVESIDETVKVVFRF